MVHAVMVHGHIHLTCRHFFSWCRIVCWRNDADDLHHASVHVVKQMAVERPVTDMFCGDVDADPVCRLDRYCVLARHVMTTAIHEIEKHAVQMDRVWHHCIVYERQANTFTLVELD